MNAGRPRPRVWTRDEILAAVHRWLEGRETARINDYIQDARADPDHLPSYEEQRRRIGDWHTVRLLAGGDMPAAWSRWTEERVVAALRGWLSGRSSARIADFFADSSYNPALPSDTTIRKYFPSWRAAVKGAGGIPPNPPQTSE